jgi:hypothetical protein
MPSTSCFIEARLRKDVDARHEAGHDGGEARRAKLSFFDGLSFVMAGFIPAIHFLFC